MGEGADPGGGVWAAGESCEERGEGADVVGEGVEVVGEVVGEVVEVVGEGLEVVGEGADPGEGWETSQLKLSRAHWRVNCWARFSLSSR